MKPKPLRKKEGKTFTFQPFSERIQHIDIPEIVHKVKHVNEEEEEKEETFLYQAILKWNGLNTSESYNSLCRELTRHYKKHSLSREVTHHVKTLPQAIGQKNQLITTLIKYLELKDEYSLQPTLEFIIALAKDLTYHEFYEYFPSILPHIINCLYCKNYEQIEWTFQCLTYLFKVLWKKLAQDIDNVLPLLLPLLGSSQPLYIVSFSAQSFAYVARKIKNRKHFIKLILKSLKKYPEGEEGCGTLIYETIKGVGGKLNYGCAENFLSDMITSLGDESLDTSLLTRVLSHTVDLLISRLEPDQSRLVWTHLIKNLSIFIKSENTPNREQSILNILAIMKLMAEFKRGCTLLDPKPIIDLVVMLIRDASMSEAILQEVVILSAALQRCASVKISQEYACHLAYNVLKVPHRHLYLDFVERVFSCAGFYTLVLPSLLNYCETSEPGSDLLELLTKLVLHKVPTCSYGSAFDDWNRIAIDFTNKNQNNLIEYMTSQLSSTNNNTDNIIFCILILPHIQAPPTHLMKLHTSLKSFLHNLEKEDDSFDDETSLYIYSITIECLLRISPDQCDFNVILNNVSSRLDNVCALRTIDLCLTVLKVDIGCLENDAVKQLKTVCINNLSSPYSQIRTLSSHILTLLKPINTEEENTMFDLIYEAETTDNTIQTYRDKLSNIQKLETFSSKIGLKYMFGILYVNFQLLWKPVCTNIVTLSTILNEDIFWEEYHKMLQTLKNATYTEISAAINTEYSFISEHYDHLTSLNDKPDHGNVRLLLLDTLKELKRIIGRKNRDVVTLFIDFINFEFRKNDAETAKSWNIKIRDEELSDDDNDDEEEEEEEEVEEEEEDGDEDNDASEENNKSMTKKRKSIGKETRKNKRQKKNEDDDDDNITNDEDELDKTLETTMNSSVQSHGRTHKNKKRKSKPNSTPYNKNLIKLFISHFNVMSSMDNAKAIYKSDELRNIYEDFLSHRNSIVQKVALDCILNYEKKDKNLVLYKDNLYGIVDEKSFRNQLIMFSISDGDGQDEEINNVGKLKSQHRTVVMPIVLRIVYGKMLGGAGPKSGSKSSGAVRRSMILRFLAGCKEEEFQIFLKMAFKNLSMYTKIEHPLDMVNEILTNINLEQVIPPKRLLSLMNLANVVLLHCGSLAMDQLFRIIICIISYVNSILNQRSLVHSGYLNILNKVKAGAIASLNEYFERYIVKTEYVDAIFNAVVWFGLEKFNSEGVYSPTGLTKLFLTWSKDPKYFSLLVKYKDESDQQHCALNSMIQLLMNGKTHYTVRLLILEFIENLVTLENDKEADDEEMNLQVNNTVVKNKVDNLNLNYGSFILKPYVLSILRHYQVKLKSKKDGLNTRDLAIISRTTELVSDEKTSIALVNVLIPLIIKKVRIGEQIINPLLVTLLNLVKNIQNGNQFLRSLGVLFLTLTDTTCRILLIDIVSILVEKINDESIDISIIKDLNAMNKKWVDQPDFDRRLDAFNRIQKLITEQQKISPIQGAIIIYTAMHYMQYEKDISLRSSSSYCLQKICPYVSHMYKDDNKNKQYIVQSTILALIKNNLLSRKTDFKEDSIMLLGYMVRECPSLHPVLKDLHQFSCKTDLEIDFFETVLHIQLHRRSRAMLRFIEIAKTLTKAPKARTITNYLIPIISQFLLNEKYADNNTVIDSAVAALSTCCKLLRWYEYESILTQYLGKLKSINMNYQKQIIKIISGLLDAFHFDLTNAYQDGKKVVIPPVPVVEEEDEVVEDEPDEELSKSNIQDDDDEEEDDDKTNDNDDEDEEESDTENEVEQNNNLKDKACILDKLSILTKHQALKVIHSISKDILPGLYKVLVMKSQSESVHKSNRKRLGPDRDEEDLMKVPVAVAIVTLLQKLPPYLLQRNLPGLFMKLCTFLRSKLETVRKCTRETLQKIMMTLGAKYLGALVKEMKSLLNKGFQAHVLAFTLHAVLVSLKDTFKKGDLDHCTLQVIDVFSTDLFGEVAEEKEVEKIQSKVVEARSQKSFDAFCILAQYVSEKFLLNLVLPVKEVLSNSFSHKMISKASSCLRHIALGLADNKFVSLASQLTFAYGVVSQSITALVPPPKEEKKSKLLVAEKPDCFIIPKEPRKVRSVEKKTAEKINANILIEFGLQIYYVILKREKLKKDSEDYRGHLDPVVPIMAQCLESEHVKLNTLSLQCLVWLVKIDLPSMAGVIKSITSTVFKLLHKYAALGMGKGDNYELVFAAFKYVGVLLRDVKSYIMDKEQLETLLLYVEQDLHDYSRQATAFLVLKAILNRKLECGKLQTVMKGVATLAITSHHINARVQAKQSYITYLYEYPLEKKSMESHLSFIISQLDYDIKEGRDCALDMIDSIVQSFPLEFVHEYCELLFVSCAARLINDPEPELRKKIAALIIKLINKIDKNNAEKLLEISLIWLNDQKISHKRLGAQLCGIYLENKDLKLVDRNLPNIISSLRKQFVGYTVRKRSEEDEDDHHVYQVLISILKLIERYPNILTDKEHEDFIEDIGEHCQRLLSHEHVWIRLAGCQILFKIFSSIKPADIALVANDESLEDSNAFLKHNTREKIKSLILDHIDQLVSDQISDLLNQVMKNLVYLAQVVKDFKKSEDDKISLRWMIVKLRRRVHEEITKNSLSFTVRKMCFNWLAAMAIKLDKEELESIALCALTPLVREMNTHEEKFEDIRQVATEAANYYKKRLGHETYTKIVSTLQQRIDVRRSVRKVERAQELIKDPEKAAKRKITKQLKRKEQKKKKMEMIKKKYKDQ